MSKRPHYKKAGRGAKQKKFRFKSVEEKEAYAVRMGISRTRGENPTVRGYAKDQMKFKRDD